MAMATSRPCGAAVLLSFGKACSASEAIALCAILVSPLAPACHPTPLLAVLCAQLLSTKSRADASDQLVRAIASALAALAPLLERRSPGAQAAQVRSDASHEEKLGAILATHGPEAELEATVSSWWLLLRLAIAATPPAPHPAGVLLTRLVEGARTNCAPEAPAPERMDPTRGASPSIANLQTTLIPLWLPPIGPPSATLPIAAEAKAMAAVRRRRIHALQLTTRLITRSNGMGNIQGEPTASAAARLLPLLLAVACEPDALISGCAVAAVRALAQALSPSSAKGAVVPALPTVPDAPAPKLTPRRSTRRGASADASPVSTAAANPAAAVPPASLPGAAEASSFPLLFTSGGGEVEAAEAYTATQARGRGQGSKGQATGCA